MAFMCKGIKPKRLKVKEIRLEILNALRREGTATKKEMEKTVQYWKGDKPRFEVAIGLTGEDASVMVGPTNPIKGARKWQWLDEGTKDRYNVVPKRAKALRFLVGGSPGSSPNSLTVKPARPGTKVVYAKRIKRISGINARNWSELIAKHRKKPFLASMMDALHRGMEKAQQ